MHSDTASAEMNITLTPVGHVENTITEKTFTPHGNDDPEERLKQIKKHRKETRDTLSTLVIRPRYAELLDGIEQFSHIVVVYWPHRLPPEDRQLQKVHPMGRKEIPLQGIFATRSPARPNPLLISTVQLHKRKDNTLQVQGLEALDKSPILDIKPITRALDTEEPLRYPQWIHDINQDLNRSD